MDCCDREAMSWIATTGGYTGNDVRDVMLAAVEHRFGNVDAVPSSIEWLSDHGSGCIPHETRAFASGIGLMPLTTPVCNPQSNGTAESFVKTMKRDYLDFMSKPDTETAVRNLAIVFEHYNERRPHPCRNTDHLASSGAGWIYQLKYETVSGRTRTSPVATSSRADSPARSTDLPPSIGPMGF
jgi:transposase InsO family protein